MAFKRAAWKVGKIIRKSGRGTKLGFKRAAQTIGPANIIRIGLATGGAAIGSGVAYGAHRMGGRKRRTSKARTAGVTAGGFFLGNIPGAAAAYGTHKYLNRKRRKR